MKRFLFLISLFNFLLAHNEEPEPAGACGISALSGRDQDPVFMDAVVRPNQIMPEAENLIPENLLEEEGEFTQKDMFLDRYDILKRYRRSLCKIPNRKNDEILPRGTKSMAVSKVVGSKLENALVDDSSYVTYMPIIYVPIIYKPIILSFNTWVTQDQMLVYFLIDENNLENSINSIKYSISVIKNCNIDDIHLRICRVLKTIGGVIHRIRKLDFTLENLIKCTRDSSYYINVAIG